ncbi:MAG: hypothetical protein HYY38_01335 [Rhodospirillales bacterium]|nr:hypothetical protein [Rhodospirillales bacterium]
MRPRFLAAALAAVAFVAINPGFNAAFAQEDPDNNGRYQIVNGIVATGPGGAGQSVTIMLDTQVGRTWMITTGPEGIHWVRLQTKMIGKVPDNMILRPAPVAPLTPPK